MACAHNLSVVFLVLSLKKIMEGNMMHMTFPIVDPT